MISTRGRYALRVLVDLAENQPEDGYLPLKDIATRQDISQKYLEGIMTTLSKAGMVEGVHGKGGGYRLRKTPAEYSIYEILSLTETSMAPVACLEKGAATCDRADACKTLPVWSRLNQMMNDYLDSVSLADLMEQPGE